jgi:hypothetical protein
MKLDFRFLQGDEILEARVDGGFYHISSDKHEFLVTACVVSECYRIGVFQNIYDALDAANNHYKGK